VLREGDTIGRFGGDEFVVVANAVEGPRAAGALAQRLIRSLATPFTLDGVEVVVGVSVGVAVAAAGVGDPQQLIRDADAAMYEAKNRGRGVHVVFESPMHDEVVERLQLEADLRRAVPGEELMMHYQPLVQVADRTVVGLEALVRWNRPGRGLVMPAQFVDVAEETGLIVPLGSWVLREVVRQAASWSRDPLLAGLHITTNLSARQMVEPGLVQEVKALTDEFGVDPSRLWLEVTESVLADDPYVVARVIEELSAIGVRVAIDDFGSGYTSLEYARQLARLAGLKIDRQFVVDLDDPGSHSEAIVAALVVLGRGLDAVVVAEGVESESQFEVLRRLGCDLVQGYLFGRPVAGREIRERILALQSAETAGVEGPDAAGASPHGRLRR
jgi:predicted signal transduction protein with EAL and GGDEF domain